MYSDNVMFICNHSARFIIDFLLHNYHTVENGSNE